MPTTTRPNMPTAEAQAISEYLRMRESILLDDAAAQEWLAEYLVAASGTGGGAQYGIPDSSLSPLAAQTRQLTTPGLYGRVPDFRPGPGDDELADVLTEAGFWAHAQALQFRVVGVGIYWRKLRVRTVPVTVDEDGTQGIRAKLVDELVSPGDVFPIFHPDDPTELVELRHLRTRDGAYAWDVWSTAGGGSYRVHEARQDGTLGADLSGLYLRDADGTGGALIGDRYPARDPAGRPFIPFVPYVAEDVGDGQIVPLNWRRTTYRGTFRACSYWTFTARAALYATGEHTLLGGVDLDALPAVKVQQVDGGIGEAPAADTVWTQQIAPGSITALPVRDGQSLTSVAIGPGLNLPNLLAFSSAYSQLLADGDGLPRADVSQSSSPYPSSGVALQIEASGRREFSAQVEPLFHRSDMLAVRYVVWLLRPLGVVFADSGYSIGYHRIPLSPTEQADLRADTDWQRTHKMIGPVSAYRRIHPGLSEDQAREALVRAAIEDASLRRAVDDALVAAGLGVRPVPPKPPSPDVPDMHDTTDPTP